MTEESKRAIASCQDDGERERLLVEQLPQVRYIARRIHERLPRHVLLEDMVHAGVVGLIDALQKFDGSKHVQFGSYAKFRIRGAILDSLREMDWSPRDLRRKARRLEEAHNTLRSSLGRDPSEAELAAELGITLLGLQLLVGEISGLEVGSLRVESPLDGREQDLCECLPDDSEETPLFLCLRSEMTQLLARAIALADTFHGGNPLAHPACRTERQKPWPRDRKGSGCRSAMKGQLHDGTAGRGRRLAVFDFLSCF